MTSISQRLLRPRCRVAACVLALLLPAGAAVAQAAANPKRPPNVVLIFADDHGYSDSGPYRNAQDYATPNIDALARGGMRLGDFYVATAVCSASRAALLTGTYPKRLGVVGALDHTTRGGLDPDEVTIAEVLKQRGYATALFENGIWVTDRTTCRPGRASTNTSACPIPTTCGHTIPAIPATTRRCR